MGGFVVFGKDQMWAVSNGSWQAAIMPVADLELLAPGSEAQQEVEQAILQSINYLDLSDVSSQARTEIRDAVRVVRDRYSDGELDCEPSVLADWVVRLDGLLAMFDDPTFGRPMWPASARIARLLPPGTVLERKRYRQREEHHHCDWCQAKFMDSDHAEPRPKGAEGREIVVEGYATTAEHELGADAHWVCRTCFAKFAEGLGWTARPSD